MEDLDKKYQNVLEKYLKEKFTTSFSDILEEKTKSAIETQTNISHISSSSTAIIEESEAKAKPSFCKRNSKHKL